MKKNEIDIEKLQEVCSGIMISKGKQEIVSSFSIDTRTIKSGDVFVSIKPESGEGIKYIVEAFEKGAIRNYYGI